VLQAQSDSGISGTLFQRIKSQIMNTALSRLYQPQVGREIDSVFVQKKKQNDFLSKWEIKRSAA
jgi:hypothetical protein